MQELLNEGFLSFFMQNETDMGTIIPQIVVVVVENRLNFSRRSDAKRKILMECKVTLPCAASIRECV